MKRILLIGYAMLLAMAIQAEVVRILGIGNSFTVDALEQHFQPILDAQQQEAIVGYPYRGGTWLSQHDAWSTRMDTMPYNYREFRNGKFTSTGLSTYNLTMAVELEPWDYVVFQSDHDSAGIYSSYEPYLTHLVNYIQTHCSNKEVKIGFYMTWAYDSISTYSAFKLYKNNTQIMYDSIISAAKKVMETHPNFFLIPAGTAIQNARTSYIGQKLNRDGYHLNYNYGRYIASLCWYKAIFGVEPEAVTYAPSSISDYCASMCRAAVREAFQKPWEVTSLKEQYGKSEEENQPANESRLRRVTFNGMNVPILPDVYEYDVPVDAAIEPSVTMYSFPRSQKAEQNITDSQGADIERDPTNYGYFPLPTPALGQTLTYTNRVLAEDLVTTTTYTFRLIGTAAEDLLYTIGSREDLEDFAKAVNRGSYGLNAELTNSFSMDHTKQDCWATPIGTTSHPYTGTFDGKGYAISGFNIYAVDREDLYALEAVGLFGAIKNATLKNINLTGTEESYFNRPSGTMKDMNKYCGILCGWMANSTISRCYVSCPIFTNLPEALGYICGYDNSVGSPSIIDRCYSEGTWRIRRNGQYGGILGYGYNVNITNCYSLTKLQLQKDFAARMGGIVAYANANNDSRAVHIENCYFAGKITDERKAQGATTSQTAYLGAIASAFNGGYSTLTNVYYLIESAPQDLAQHKNYISKQSATVFSQEDLTNGSLVTKLGSAFVQGTNHPEIGEGGTDATGLDNHLQATDKRGRYTKYKKIFMNGQIFVLYDGKHYSIR